MIEIAIHDGSPGLANRIKNYAGILRTFKPGQVVYYWRKKKSTSEPGAYRGPARVICQETTHWCGSVMVDILSGQHQNNFVSDVNLMKNWSLQRKHVEW